MLKPWQGNDVALMTLGPGSLPPDPTWREDIAAYRVLSNGLREFLIYNNALCRPYYVAVYRQREERRGE